MKSTKTTIISTIVILIPRYLPYKAYKSGEKDLGNKKDSSVVNSLRMTVA